MSTAVDLAAQHIEALLTSSTRRKKGPLVVGIQGPQGIGKSTLVAHLEADLARAGHRAASLSIDDVYLPHDALQQLAREHPHNRLLHGRGLPGTHDVALGEGILVHVQSRSTQPLRLPRYDKARHGGQGDRLPEAEWKVIDDGAALDVFLLEGWCLGFPSRSRLDIERRYHQAAALAKQTQAQGEEEEDLQQPLHFSLQHPLAALLELNDNLHAYEQRWYPHIDAYIQLWPASPSSISEQQQASYTHLDAFPPHAKHLVFTWRLHAEHWMKTHISQGRGMSDEQVRVFVARYMPAYELFSGVPPRGRGGSRGGQGEGDGEGEESMPTLRIELDAQRAVVRHGIL